MTPAPLPAASRTAPDAVGSFGGRLLSWLGGSALATLLVAWLAFQIKAGGVAPEVLFPAAVGLVLGVVLVQALRASAWPVRRGAVVASLAWAAVAIVGQEFCGYRHYRRQYAQLQDRPGMTALARAATAEMEPAGFGPFLAASIERRGRTWWTFDALLTAGTAVAVVACQVSTLPKPRAASCEPAADTSCEAGSEQDP